MKEGRSNNLIQRSVWWKRSSFFSTVILLPTILLEQWIPDGDVRSKLEWTALIAIFAAILTLRLIPQIQHRLQSKGLFGKDLCKRGLGKSSDKPIPEAVGLVPGIVFVICMILCQSLYATSSRELAVYNAATLSICFMLLLGFVDDVLDIPWRIKIMLPAIAALPLLCSYDGKTDIIIPKIFRGLFALSETELSLFGELVDAIPGLQFDRAAGGAIVRLGFFYFVYMGLLAVFCSNAINIYAGVNGLEAGQSVVIATACLTLNMLRLTGLDAVPQYEAAYHMFSAILLIPFVATTVVLLRFNWYPARVFVGDTFCYYAGMTVAVCGILGHYSKTLLLFLIPQIFNFLLSLPQLFKFLPCPRHRLPRIDKSGLLHPSTYDLSGKERMNLTLINLWLKIAGPMKEDKLTTHLLVLQVLCCVLGFMLQSTLSGFLF